MIAILLFSYFSVYHSCQCRSLTQTRPLGYLKFKLKVAINIHKIATQHAYAKSAPIQLSTWMVEVSCQFLDNEHLCEATKKLTRNRLNHRNGYIRIINEKMDLNPLICVFLHTIGQITIMSIMLVKRITREDNSAEKAGR